MGFEFEIFQVQPSLVWTFLHFSTRHLKLINFFTQVLLELNFENFLKFFSNPVDLNWTFEIFLKFFQPCLIEVGL